MIFNNLQKPLELILAGTSAAVIVNCYVHGINNHNGTVNTFKRMIRDPMGLELLNAFCDFKDYMGTKAVKKVRDWCLERAMKEVIKLPHPRREDIKNYIEYMRQQFKNTDSLSYANLH